MHRSMKIGTAVGIAALAMIAIPVGGSATADTANPTECDYSKGAVPDVLPEPCDDAGDTLGVKINGDSAPDITVTIPDPGTGVVASLDGADGSEHSLDVFTSVDGTETHVAYDAQGEGSGSSTTGGPAKCDDYYYTFERAAEDNKKVLIDGTWEWYSNLGSTPAGLTQSSTLADLKHAAAVISNTASTCDSRDLNPASQTYMGDRALSGGVNSDNTCDAYSDTDFISNVGFGAINYGNTIAATCRWYASTATTLYGESARKLLEADVRFDTGVSWKNTTNAGTCTNQFSIDGVATHEFGHVWGLGHVSEEAHGHLTMSTMSDYCEFSQSSLGYGDLSGLAHLYNVL